MGIFYGHKKRDQITGCSLDAHVQHSASLLLHDLRLPWLLGERGTTATTFPIPVDESRRIARELSLHAARVRSFPTPTFRVFPNYLVIFPVACWKHWR